MKEQKEITIQVPDGYEIDKEKSTFEKIVFKEVKKILTYKDISCKLLAAKETFWIHQNGDVVRTKLWGASINNCNNSVTKEQLESILALNKLCNVAKYLNGDWLPEKSRSGSKWFISIQFEDLLSDKTSITIYHHNTVQYSCVYFKSKELAQQAIEILGEEEIRKALTLNH